MSPPTDVSTGIALEDDPEWRLRWRGAGRPTPLQQTIRDKVLSSIYVDDRGFWLSSKGTTGGNKLRYPQIHIPGLRLDERGQQRLWHLMWWMAYGWVMAGVQQYRHIDDLENHHIDNLEPFPPRNKPRETSNLFLPRELRHYLGGVPFIS